MASVGSCQKLPPCLIEPMPAVSKTDPLLAKAKPISNSASASGIMYVRRGKIYCAGAISDRERSENTCEQQLTDTKVNEEGKEELLQVPEQIPLQSMEVHGEADRYPLAGPR